MGIFSKKNKGESFKFFVPVSFEKGTTDTADGKYLIKVKGVASSKTEDTDGETLDPSGFTVKKGALINWNHQASKTSSAICGKVLTSSIINDGQDFYVEGGIYNNTEGRSVAELIDTVKGDPDIVIGWSIEGKVTSRHPLDQKKITGAVISGIALTHMPKNGNTWVDIVKGQYNELDPENEEEDKEENEIEKDMSAAGTQDLTCHDPAPPAKPKNQDGLTKSQVYEKIIERTNIKDFVFINKIYNFVKSIQDNDMEDTSKISAETLEKAITLLENISKGESTEEVVVTEQTTTAPVEDAVDVVKAEQNEFAKSLHATGISKEECIEGMIRKGYGYTDSLTAVEKAITETPAAEGANTIVKAEDVAKLVLADISKSLTETIGKSFDPLNDKITKGFGAVNELFKSQGEENTLLKGEISKLTERLKKVEDTPLGTKSVRNVNVLDKFAKSENGEGVPAGFREVSVNDTIEKSLILGELETNYDLAKSEGEKRIWGDAMAKVEIAGLGNLNPEVAKRLKVVIVN